MWTPSFRCLVRADGEREYRIGNELVDEFLEFVSVRARPNTVKAYAHDLKVFFSVVGGDPVDIGPADVLAFVTEQNRPRDGADNVVRISDGRAGLSASTIKRRLAAVSSLYGYLVTKGTVTVSPVPRGLPTRKSRHRGERGLPLVGGLRRCEVLGLRLEDLRLGEWRVFIADGKGGHQRLVPVSQSFFATVADYLNTERPVDAATDRVFVALKGPRHGQPLSPDGLDTVLTAARARAGLAHGTCHELRHTCFTRLREGGMAIEALQAQAGHRSMESTRIYLLLGADWLAGEYKRAAEAIEAQAAVGAAR